MLKDLCFEILKACPNNCLFCSSNAGINCNEVIELELFKKTLNHIYDKYGIEEISISGGEPFLHPNLFEIIKACKEKNIRTIIFTSGIKRNSDIPLDEKEVLIEEMKKKLEEIEKHEPWNQKAKDRITNYYQSLLNPRNFTNLSTEELQKLKDIGLDKIVFDWQALTEDNYNELMGTKKLLTSLLTSVIKASSVGLDIDVHFIPNKINYQEFPDILECLEIAGVKNISILNFVPQGRGEINQERLLLDSEEMQEFIDIYNNCKDLFTGKIRVGIPLSKDSTHKCTAGLDKLVIKYDGTVLPCPAFKEIDIELLEKYGVKKINIRENLEDIRVINGTRKNPLCKTIYDNNKLKI
ncbi:MAG: radical SAM protein [Bacilli bacterium]|nr:radical SAM protein [Bacilli bacterium]